MPFVWTVVIGLAAFRLYRITGKDSLTEFFHGWIHARARKSAAAYWAFELISCPWCIGFWYSLALTAAAVWLDLISMQQALPVAFAASAVCGLTQRVDQYLEANTPNR